MPFAAMTSAAERAKSAEAKRVSYPITSERLRGLVFFRYAAVAWAQTETLSKVKSLAIMPRQPSVPNLIWLVILAVSFEYFAQYKDNRAQNKYYRQE